MGETAWVLNHLDDLESDFSAFHRIDDIYSLEAVKFQRFAFRLAAYEGVIQARIRAQDENGSSSYSGEKVQELSSSQTALQASPIGDLFEFG